MMLTKKSRRRREEKVDAAVAFRLPVLALLLERIPGSQTKNLQP